MWTIILYGALALVLLLCLLWCMWEALRQGKRDAAQSALTDAERAALLPLRFHREHAEVTAPLKQS